MPLAARRFALLACTLGVFASAPACSSDEGGAVRGPFEADGVTVYYYRADFKGGKGGFTGSKRVRQKLAQDGAAGNALRTECLAKWAGPRLKVDIEGSEGLKMAFLAKGEGFDRATLNVYDEAQDDNTTPYAYRWLPDGRWTPVLYRLDRFRYNSRRTGFVRPDARYSELRFYGPEPKGRPVALTLDNFVIYRGEDRSPPGVVSGLRAKATEQGVFLHWAPAPDNVAPMLYVVSRAGSDGTFRKIAETFETRFLDTSAPRGPVRYRVLACDFQNNLGPWSEPVAVVSVSEGRARSLTPVERDRLAYAEQVRAVHERGKGSVRRGHVCLYGDSLTGPTVYRQMVEGALGIYTVGAKGFAGMRTGWGRKNALKKALEPENPEFVLVMFGTNDVRGKRRAPETYRKWVDALVDIVRQAEARGTVAVLGTIPPRGFDDPASRPEAEFNRMLVARARELGVPVAYVFDEIQSSGDRRRFIYKDGVHWTVGGMEAAARAWARTMRQIEFALRDRP